MTSDIFFSYIIPTIGRSSLNNAVNSVLTQKSPKFEFEIIVVNDSGFPLQEAIWHDLPQIQIINTNKSERCFARNSGAAIAKGKYLAFLDDDDWVLPDALKIFWELAGKYPKAAWLYGGIQVVNEKEKILAEINSGFSGNCFAEIMGGAWAPLQASLIKSKVFFDIGGFNPLINGTEDEDLCRRTAYYGDFANTSEVVACLFRGETWNTSTNYMRAPEDTKYSRDLILSKPNALRRLLNSEHGSYWYGRALRVYLSTLVWNLKQKNIFTFLSRLVSSAALLIFSLGHLFSREFWKGLGAEHVPDTLHFVMENVDRANLSNF